MKIRGSCLCGGVNFEADLPFDRFVHCHCSRCRKATGTAHASNAVVQPSAFRWLVGAEHVSRFDLPTARSFATSFCRRCGSPLPHATRSGREVIIPAGALDADPVSKPDRHLHWGSRAPWYGDGLPKEQCLSSEADVPALPWAASGARQREGSGEQGGVDGDCPAGRDPLRGGAPARARVPSARPWAGARTGVRRRTRGARRWTGRRGRGRGSLR